MEQAMGQINYLAVVAAAVAAFVLGGLWYSLLFGKAWMALTGITEERAANAGAGCGPRNNADGEPRELASEIERLDEATYRTRTRERVGGEWRQIYPALAARPEMRGKTAFGLPAALHVDSAGARSSSLRR